MMRIDDDLFDSEIRQKLKSEIKYVPKDINKKIDDAVKRIEKRRFNVKKVCSIFAGCIGITILLGMAMPTYASNVPIIGSIFQMFHSKIYENYDKYASDLNITKESNGVKMTINKVVYDELQLSIFYVVESKEKLPDFPRFPGAELKINGKKTSFGAGGTGKLSDDGKTFVGSIEYHVSKKSSVPKEIQEKTSLGGYVEIPDEFVFTLNIDEIGTADDNKSIKGKWDFNIPVSSEKVSGKVKEQECDIDLSNIYSGYHIKKIITTPLNTAIQGTKIDADDNSGELYFAVFDDKGRYIEGKSGGGFGKGDIMYFNIEFKEVYDDTESLTFFPYKENNSNDEEDGSNNSKNEVTAKLNLQGETKLYSSDGKEYATITKIKTEYGKTKIYYKSKYGAYVTPIEITNDKTNEKILSIDDDEGKQMEDITYVSNSDEYVITYDDIIPEGDYSIKVIDKSKYIKVYNDDKFTINVK